MDLDIQEKIDYKTPAQIPAQVFRAYDIRGIVDDELTTDLLYTIGLAIGSEARDQGVQEVVVGRDGRLSGPAFYQAMYTGLMHAGVDVILIGEVPSPVLYFATSTLSANTGVMVTGSHNPSNYNGIKIVMNGRTLSANGIQSIYQRIIARKFHRGQGHQRDLNVIPDYINDVCQRVKLARPLKIVIDCGNGVAANVAPQLFKQLGCEVETLFGEVDGRFPNHHPDPTIPENLQDLIARVRATGADCGLAFDGDADRLGLVDDQGQIIWPDRQMMLFSQDLLARQPGSEIVFDVKCSRNLATVIEQAGGKPLMYKTGHSILKAKMIEVGSPLAGEMSGHIFFKENWYGFDDGIYVGARFLGILAAGTKKVSEIFAELPDSVNTPELKVAIADDKKHAFVERFVKEAVFPDATIFDIDGARIDFGDGWALVRASNTTPCLTLRFEADTEQRLAEIQALVKQQLLQLDSELVTPF